MGYFFGKIGRNRVILLHKGNLEIPSDIYGLVYIGFDEILESLGKVDENLRSIGLL